jgi:uncharacterized membrane protein
MAPAAARNGDRLTRRERVATLPASRFPATGHMNPLVTQPRVPERARLRALLFGLAFLAAAAGIGWFVRRDALTYATLDPDKLTDYYWPRRYPLWLHIGGGFLALTAGLTQVALGLSGRTRGLHRWLGRLYLLPVTAAVLAAFYLISSIPLSMYSAGLLGLALCWAVTSSMGYRAARRGAFAEHRDWMLRSYVVTFGFVSLRLIQNAIMGFGWAGEDASVAIAAWLCWLVPLVIAEPLIRGQRSAALRVTSAD